MDDRRWGFEEAEDWEYETPSGQPTSAGVATVFDCELDATWLLVQFVKVLFQVPLPPWAPAVPCGRRKCATCSRG